MRILIASDAHVPDRVSSIPEIVKRKVEELAPFDLVVYAGDLTGQEVLDWLKTLGEDVIAVKGNMDYLPLPEKKVFEVDNVRFLVVHGHQVRPRGNLDALSEMAESVGAKIIVHGHLHKPVIVEHKGVFHINPGTLTGSWGGYAIDTRPSFVVLDTDQWKGKLYTFDGEIKVAEFEVPLIS